MLKIGYVQTLKVQDITMKGALLVCDKNEESVILAADLIPRNTRVGDKLEIFVFSDHFGNLVASLKKPLAEAGDISYLKVQEFTSKGAYLDWGFIVELFSPRDNIFYNLQEGKSYLFRLFVNKEGKIRATTDIYDHLKTGSKYQKDDPVIGVVYKKLENGSTLVAIDNIYFGLVPKTENYIDLEYGDKFSGRVIRVRDDGKLDVSTRKKAGIQLIDDSEILLKKMRANKGILHLTDRSSPEKIKAELNISKKAFKRAVGRLLKDEYIKKNEDSLELI